MSELIVIVDSYTCQKKRVINVDVLHSIGITLDRPAEYTFCWNFAGCPTGIMIDFNPSQVPMDIARNQDSLLPTPWGQILLRSR